MKKLKKIWYMAIITLMITTSFSRVFASELKTTLNVIQQSSEIKYLENDQGYISKAIVDSNNNTGEVTIELKLSNTKKETVTNGTTEVFFVIDNSPSMKYVTENGDVRKDLIINSAKNLATSIFSQSDSVKIGVVKFSGSGLLTSAGMSNATLVQSLSDDKDIVLAGIQKIADSSTSSGTNIDAGLQRANNNFSDECQNKIIVLFTDGVPTCDASGTNAGNDTTTDESKTVQANTKSTIQNISNSGVYIISMMTGLDPTSDTYDNDLEAITNIFGTAENSTAGKFYNIADANITNIVNNNILADVIEKIQNPINTVKIVDYFPEDITNNFEFSYVGNPSVGTVSEGIDEDIKTITWDIGTLKGDEVATLQYKLKIKDMKNENLLNKTISTNEKVVLTYKDIDSKDYTVTLTGSPKIQLSEVTENIASSTDTESQKNEDDNTVAKGTLPYTGLRIGLSLSIVVLLVGCVFAYLKYSKSKSI
ncbi:MAG: vWA domain-containing protein [Clostridia bacterium]